MMGQLDFGGKHGQGYTGQAHAPVRPWFLPHEDRVSNDASQSALVGSERMAAASGSSGGRNGVFDALGWVGGFDRKILRGCSEDVRASSAAIGVAVCVGFAIHMASMAAVCTLLGIPWYFGAMIGAVTASGLALADRVAIAAINLDRSERAIAGLAPAETPRLENWWSGLLSRAVRIGATMVTANFFAMFMALWIFDGSTRELIQQRQQMAEDVLRAEIETTLQAKEQSLLEALERADVERERLDAQHALGGQSRGPQVQELQNRREAAAAELELLKRRHGEFVETIEHLETQMRCEERGYTSAPCENASGQSGQGERYELLGQQLVRMDAGRIALANETTEIEGQLKSLDDEIFSLLGDGRDELASDQRRSQSRREQREEELSAFRSQMPEILDAMFEERREERHLNPETIANRVSAWFELQSTQPGVLLASLAIKAMALVLELSGLLAAMMSRTNEYHLGRGELLIEATHRARDRAAQIFLEGEQRRNALRELKRREATDVAADAIFETSVATAKASSALSSRRTHGAFLGEDWSKGEMALTEAGAGR